MADRIITQQNRDQAINVWNQCTNLSILREGHPWMPIAELIADFNSRAIGGCHGCRYSLPNGTALECHKNPPPWHSVGPDDWCGHWELRPLPLLGSSADDDKG